MARTDCARSSVDAALWNMVFSVVCFGRTWLFDWFIDCVDCLFLLRPMFLMDLGGSSRGSTEKKTDKDGSFFQSLSAIVGGWGSRGYLPQFMQNVQRLIATDWAGP